MEHSILIAGFPESAFVIMVTDADSQEIDRAYSFLPQLVDTVREKAEEFKTGAITVYGPDNYIAPLKSMIEGNIEGVEVKLAAAGKECL